MCKGRSLGTRLKMTSLSSAVGLWSALRLPSSYRALDGLRREIITRAGIIFGALAARLGASTSRELGEESRDFNTLTYNAALSNPIHDVSCELNTIWDGFLWAVPKKRTSHSKKRMRMAHKYLKPKHHYQTCPRCQNLKLQHMLCGHCFRETMKRTAEFRNSSGECGENLRAEINSFKTVESSS